MDYNSALLILRLVAEGIGVVDKISELAQRVENGEIITDEEIQEARDAVNEAAEQWNDA